jgi:hypothetical protein
MFKNQILLRKFSLVGKGLISIFHDMYKIIKINFGIGYLSRHFLNYINALFSRHKRYTRLCEYIPKHLLFKSTHHYIDLATLNNEYLNSSNSSTHYDLLTALDSYLTVNNLCDRDSHMKKILLNPQSKSFPEFFTIFESFISFLKEKFNINNDFVTPGDCTGNDDNENDDDCTENDGTKTDDDGTKPDDDGTETDDDGTETDDDGTETDDDGTETDDDGTNDNDSEKDSDSVGQNKSNVYTGDVVGKRGVKTRAILHKPVMPQLPKSSTAQLPIPQLPTSSTEQLPKSPTTQLPIPKPSTEKRDERQLSLERPKNIRPVSKSQLLERMQRTGGGESVEQLNNRKLLIANCTLIILTIRTFLSTNIDCNVKNILSRKINDLTSSKSFEELSKHDVIKSQMEKINDAISSISSSTTLKSLKISERALAEINSFLGLSNF